MLLRVALTVVVLAIAGDAVAWLKWQLLNDRGASKVFVGSDCRLCTDPQWQAASRSLK